VQAVAIHGDISQGQRTSAVEKFKSGEVPLLVATDVAARGLDIPDVEVGWGGWLGSARPVVRPCMPSR
jgi:superfamily II DNA/RNA helicase